MANELAQLQKQREKLVAEIDEIDTKIEELTAEKRQELLEQLKELGWSPAGKRKRSDGERVCSVCGEKGHNARRHTKEEIAEAKRKKKKENAA